MRLVVRRPSRGPTAGTVVHVVCLVILALVEELSAVFGVGYVP